MSDDAVTKFISQAKAAPKDGSPQQTLPPSLVAPSADGREPYKAVDNKVLATSVDIRCYRTGLSYSIDYAQLSSRVFEFLTGEKLSFSGGGFGVVIKGRNLREILRALNLHTCGFVQDFHRAYFLPPDSPEADAPFVESIDVVVLRPAPPPVDRKRDQASRDSENAD